MVQQCCKEIGVCILSDLSGSRFIDKVFSRTPGQGVAGSLAGPRLGSPVPIVVGY